jgi:hypothetical protein
MSKIVFPKQLIELLDGSEFETSLRNFANKAEVILADNKLSFFPDYTDHGIDHINQTLKTEVKLVPQEVWDSSKSDSDPRLLCDVDAALLIGATLLHDIAMHICPAGFLELVSKDSRFRPLAWFNKTQDGHSEDLPWFELWQNYIREARRFSERQLTNIIGEKSASTWKFDNLLDDIGTWELNHKLIIGEFIRRHQYTINISSLRDPDCFYCHVFYKYLVPMGSGYIRIMNQPIF